MNIDRRSVLAALTVSVALPLSPSLAMNAPSWDGHWSGKLDNTYAVSIDVAGNRAVGYAFMGAPVAVKFSNVKNDALIFGDPDNYSFKLTRTGGATAIGSYHGRRGTSKVVLRWAPK
jgi:hypothetical protein